jgi:hypothetical protein
MGCGCKKNKTTQVVAEPTQINVSLDENQVNQQTNNGTLPDQQQLIVDAIVEKLNQIKQ